MWWCEFGIGTNWDIETEPLDEKKIESVNKMIEMLEVQIVERLIMVVDGYICGCETYASNTVDDRRTKGGYAYDHLVVELSKTD